MVHTCEHAAPTASYILWSRSGRGSMYTTMYVLRKRSHTAKFVRSLYFCERRRRLTFPTFRRPYLLCECGFEFARRVLRWASMHICNFKFIQRGWHNLLHGACHIIWYVVGHITILPFNLTSPQRAIHVCHLHPAQFRPPPTLSLIWHSSLMCM